MEPGGGGSADGESPGGPVQDPLFQVRVERSGPLPHYGEFQGYEDVLPGSADRILRMAEEAQRAHIEADLTPIKAEAFALRAATVGVSFFPWLAVAAALALVAAGQNAAAAIAGLAGLFSAGPQIIAATRRPQQKRQ